MTSTDFSLKPKQDHFSCSNILAAKHCCPKKNLKINEIRNKCITFFTKFHYLESKNTKNVKEIFAL